MQHVFECDWFSGNIPWFRKYLAHLRGEPCCALEIGCHEGRASTWLLENILTHPDSRLTAIDMYLQERFWENIKSSGGLGKTQLLIKPSRQALRELPFCAYDFIYIDGSHWTIDVLEDAVLSFRLAKVGCRSRVRRLPLGRSQVEPGGRTQGSNRCVSPDLQGQDRGS